MGGERPPEEGQVHGRDFAKLYGISFCRERWNYQRDVGSHDERFLSVERIGTCCRGVQEAEIPGPGAYVEAVEAGAA
ncbi:hypothetical protein CCP3SC1AL1_3490002 [Gammaproteobacteria bacterium]